jgi:hypothetical protein
MLGFSYKCTCNMIFQLGFSLAGVWSWSPVVSLLGCCERGLPQVRGIFSRSRSYLATSPQAFTWTCPPFPSSAPTFYPLLFNIDIKEANSPAPHFANRSTTSTSGLLFPHLTLLGGTPIHSQGRPDPKRDPRRRQRFLPPPPTLFPRV